jgi:ATP-dependent 26S proteasome regulatory subunit
VISVRFRQSRAKALDTSAVQTEEGSEVSVRRRKRMAKATFSPQERAVLESMVNPSKIKETFASVGGLSEQVRLFLTISC